MNAQEANDFRSSIGWALFAHEIDKKITYETNKLRTCSSDELLKIQAAVLALQSVKCLPDNLVKNESQ